MSSSDASKGQEAIKNSDYLTAVHHLTLALKNSQSPLWLIQRSTAYQRTGQHELALADADNAVLAAHSRGKRELIATAHFRRAVALHGLGRYGDARLCLLWCQKYNEKEKGVTMWQAKVKSDYDKAGGEGAECNQTTVKEVPDKVEEVAQKAHEEKKESSKPAASRSEKAASSKPDPMEKINAASAVPAPATTTQTPKEKIRTEWYQSTATVTIEIFAKAVPKDTAEVNIQEGSLDVSFPITAFNSTYDYTIAPLFSKIDVSKSSFRITPHKIEIILHKSNPGLKWSSLEGTSPISTTTLPEEPVPKIPDEILKEKAPAYPTSSRKGPTNWDKVLGEGDDKDEEGEEIDSFFKKLYKDADPDTKRAMMKSYQESNGTALSTSWSDVGSKKVETVPPEGLEAKKWES